jgi:NAD+ synthase (glutamine-hydrolysing)
MCRQVVAACKDGNQQVISDVRRICGEPEGSTYIPPTPQEFCNKIFHTTYMGSLNSSQETRKRAKDLAKDIGAYHTDLNIDDVTDAMTKLFTTTTNFVLKFKVHGGSNISNLALQNIQVGV